MTPPAATAAGRRPAKPAAAPRMPRRVSGPVGGRGAAAAAAALPQRAPRPQAPPRRKPVAVPRPARRNAPLGERFALWLRTLPDHRLLDRLIGGRMWIVLIGGLLVGIVTLQLSLLKLNAGIGRAVETSTTLAQSNQALQATVSRLADPARVLDEAPALGFVMPPAGTPRFRTATATDASVALRTMRVPSQTAAASAVTTTTTGVGAPATPAATTDTTASAVEPSGVTTTPAAVGATGATGSAGATGATGVADTTGTPAATGLAGATGAGSTGTVAAAGAAAAPSGGQG